jgi:hypothetical protein
VCGFPRGKRAKQELERLGERMFVEGALGPSGTDVSKKKAVPRSKPPKRENRQCAGNFLQARAVPSWRNVPVAWVDPKDKTSTAITEV